MNKNSFYLSLYNKIESFKPNVLEIICFVLYIISTITLSCFHEPWFDEFQSWGISKDSIYNILFVIPHYEAHPPLWHLILKCFTSFDIPAELSIKIPNLLFMFASIWLLLFKSPFPRIIRLVLPFTYFIFYQYAVVSRPYSMLTFALFLSATLNCSKNEKPFRYIASLGFLALTSLYGMVIATGLTLIWVYEIWNKQDIIIFIKSFLKDKRFYAMLSLFFLCLAISILILPDKKATACIIFGESDIIYKILYYIFGIITDATLMNIADYGVSDLSGLPIITHFLYIIIAIFIYYSLFKNLKNIDCLKYLALFIFLMGFFVCYIWPHHLGIISIFFIMSFWCIVDSRKKMVKLTKDFIILLISFFIVQLSWSFCSVYNEIKYEYCPAKKVYRYIKKYSLQDYKIFSEWHLNNIYIGQSGKRYADKSKFKKDEIYKEELIENTNRQIIATIINPYFNRNIFENFNFDNRKLLYLKHLLHTEAEMEQIKTEWYKNGNPDIILASFKLTSQPFYTDYLKDYVLLDLFHGGFIWKMTNDTYSLAIYVHKDKYLEIKNRIEEINKTTNTF